MCRVGTWASVHCQDLCSRLAGLVPFGQGTLRLHSDRDDHGSGSPSTERCCTAFDSEGFLLYIRSRLFLNVRVGRPFDMPSACSLLPFFGSSSSACSPQPLGFAVGDTGPRLALPIVGASFADPAFLHGLHLPPCARIQVGGFAGSDPAASTGDMVPKRHIGGAGVSTMFITEEAAPPHAYVLDVLPACLDLLGWLEGVLVPFARSLLALLFLALWGLLCKALPGRHSPLGRLLAWPSTGVPPPLAIPLGVTARPRGTVLPWHCTPMRTRARVRHGWSRLAWLLWLCGLHHLPFCVWAAPPGIPAMEAAASTVSAVLPEPLPVLSWPSPVRVGAQPAFIVEAAAATQLPLGRPVEVQVHVYPCLTTLVYAPYYQPEAWTLSFRRRDGLPGFLEHLYAHCGLACDHGLDAFAPLAPQRHAGYAMVIKYPAVLDHPAFNRGVAVIVDLSRVGGHYYATVLPKRMPYDELEGFLLPQTHVSAEPLDFHVGMRPVAWTVDEDVHLAHGDVITVVSRGSPGPYLYDVHTLFDEDTIWEPAHQVPRAIYTPGVCVVHGTERFVLHQWLFANSTVEEALAQVLRLPLAEFVHSAVRLPNLDLQGAPCLYLVGTASLTRQEADTSPSRRRRDVYTFCDLRPIGHQPRLHFSHSRVLHLPTLLALFDLSVPAGYDLEVDGARQDGDDLHVADCATLVFRLIPCPDDEDDEAPSGVPGSGGPPPPPAPDDDSSSDSSRPGPCSRPQRRTGNKKPRRTSSLFGPQVVGDRDGAVSLIEDSPSRPGYCLPGHVADCVSMVCTPYFPGRHSCHKVSVWTTSEIYDFLEHVRDRCFRVGRLSNSSGYGQPTTFYGDAASWGRHPDSVGASGTAPARWPLRDWGDRTPIGLEPPNWTVNRPEVALVAPHLQVPVQVLFIVYTPEYTPDLVLVNLPLPCDVPHAMAAVSQGRREDHQIWFPELVMVKPQPRRDSACLIGIPDWPLPSPIVLLDCTRCQGAVFSVLAPASVDREALLRLAGLPSHSAAHVYVHDYGRPMAVHDRVDLEHGRLILFSDHALVHPPILGHLAGMLREQRHWDATAFSPPTPSPHVRLFTDQGSVWHPFDHDRTATLHRDIAQSLGVSQALLTLWPSRPCMLDLFDGGHVARGILAATCQFPRPLPVGSHLCLYFLDMRPIFRGVRWQVAPFGYVGYAELEQQFAPPYPHGFLFQVEGGDASHRAGVPVLALASGQVLTLSIVPDFLTEEVGSPSSSPSDTSPSGEDDDSEGAGDRSRSRDRPAGPPPPRPVGSSLGHVPVSPTHGVHSNHVGFCPGVTGCSNMWKGAIHHHASAIGRRPNTSVAPISFWAVWMWLSASFSCLVLPLSAVFHVFVVPCPASSLFLAVLVANLAEVGGVQLHGSAAPLPEDVSHLLGACASVRGAPVWALPQPSALVPRPTAAFAPCGLDLPTTPCMVDVAVPVVCDPMADLTQIGPTLLEASLAASVKPLFEAWTLLETLQDTSERLCCFRPLPDPSASPCANMFLTLPHSRTI